MIAPLCTSSSVVSVAVAAPMIVASLIPVALSLVQCAVLCALEYEGNGQPEGYARRVQGTQTHTCRQDILAYVILHPCGQHGRHTYLSAPPLLRERLLLLGERRWGEDGEK